MSTTVTYKGTTIATISNTTKKLNTKGMYCEDDITITDTGGGGGGSEWTSGIYQSGNYIKVSPNPGAGGVSVVNGFLVFSST